jgi:hypothetical protein
MMIDTMTILSGRCAEPACDHRSSGQASSATAVVDVSIVIVNWNTRDYVRACLKSIYEHRGSVSIEVIVVDNDSSDGSADMIRRQFPDVRLLARRENLGFAGGNNAGMEVARGDCVLLLNPDTVLLDDVVARSLDYLREHPEVGVLGCQVYESRTTIQRTCFRFPSPLNTLAWVTGFGGWFPKSRIAGRASYGPWSRETARPVEVVSGMYMFIRREALEDVGLMDDQYFMFAEEADWCYRFHVAGWGCVFAPVGRILHVDGGSKSTAQASVKMYVEMQKSMLLFHQKHRGRLSWAISKSLFCISMPLRASWWLIWGALGAGKLSKHKAKQSIAASRWHWLGKEPAW